MSLTGLVVNVTTKAKTSLRSFWLTSPLTAQLGGLLYLCCCWLGLAVANPAANPAANPLGPEAIVLRSAGVQVLGSPSPIFRHQSSTSRQAMQLLYRGDIDFAVIDVPPPYPAPTIGKVRFIPLGTFPIYVGIHLPKAPALSVEQLCDIYAGKIRIWSDLDPQLPRLPILSSVLTEPNPSSYALGLACAQLRPYWRWSGSSWQARSVYSAPKLSNQLQWMQHLGSIGLFSQANAPYISLLQPDLAGSPALSASDPLYSGYGVNRPLLPWLPLLPSSPYQSVPLVNTVHYPLRGLLWVAVMQEQNYRGRSLARAQSVQRFLRQLPSLANPAFTPLPATLRPPITLWYNHTPS